MPQALIMPRVGRCTQILAVLVLADYSVACLLVGAFREIKHQIEMRHPFLVTQNGTCFITTTGFDASQRLVLALKMYAFKRSRYRQLQLGSTVVADCPLHDFLVSMLWIWSWITQQGFIMSVTSMALEYLMSNRKVVTNIAM